MVSQLYLLVLIINCVKMDLQFKKNMFCIGLFKGLIDKGLLLCVSGCFFFGGGGRGWGCFFQLFPCKCSL